MAKKAETAASSQESCEKSVGISAKPRGLGRGLSSLLVMLVCRCYRNRRSGEFGRLSGSHRRVRADTAVATVWSW